MTDSAGVPTPLLRAVPRDGLLAGVTGKRGPLVVVLGPQHSGAPLCARVLSLLGVDMANSNAAATPPSEPSRPVADGDCERRQVRQFHDRAFTLIDQTAGGALDGLAQPTAWWADPRVSAIRRDIAAFLDSRVGDGHFGFADPRTVRVLPLWRQIFSELKLAPKLILCLRNPAGVARALHERDGVNPEIGEYHWLVQMANFFQNSGDLEYCTVEYEKWFDKPSANLKTLQKFLDLDWPKREADRDLLLASVATLASSREKGQHRKPRQPIVRSFYNLVRAAAGRPADRDRRDKILSLFVTFQQLAKPIEGARTPPGKLAQALQVDPTTGADDARQRDEAAADGEARRAELAEAQRELASLRAAVAQAKGARDALQAELDVRDFRLSEGEAVRLALHEALQSSQWLLAEAAGARRQEIDGLRAARQRAELQAQTQKAAAAHWESEAARREREAAALHGALDSARLVGKTAMQALAAAVASPPPPPRSERLRAITRWLGLTAA